MPVNVMIPPEQLPINEYEELRASSFFRWATVESRRYNGILCAIWVGSWLLSGPIAAWSFRPERAFGDFLLAGAAGAWVPLLLVVGRLYLGWSYIYDRLNRARITYEETGAHDGDWWDKPPEVQARDRVLVEYQILPILARLRRTINVVSALAGINALLWWLF